MRKFGAHENVMTIVGDNQRCVCKRNCAVPIGVVGERHQCPVQHVVGENVSRDRW